MQSNLFVLPIHIQSPISAHVAITKLKHFPLEGDDNTPDLALVTHNTFKANRHLWHCHLAHLDYDTVLHMVKCSMVRGMEITTGGGKTTCEPCILGKQTQATIAKYTEMHSNTVLRHIFSNMWGKMPTCSHAGYKFFVIFIDDKLHKVSITGLKRKTDVAQSLKDFIACAELETGNKVKILCSDGGGEYTVDALAEYLKGKGIRHELTTPHTPQHNSVAKHMNCTLLNKVRAMLLNANLPEAYWYDALTHAAHLHNLSPTCALKDMTPEEAYNINKPDIFHLRIFSCKAFIHIPNNQCSKLVAKSLHCIFLGQAQNCKVYCLILRATWHS